MAFPHTVSAIMGGCWLIDYNYANEQLPLIGTILQGNNVQTENTGSAALVGSSEEIQMPYLIDPATMQRFDAYHLDKSLNMYSLNSAAPKNSVAVIQVAGVITKYSGVCGQPGSLDLAKYIQDMQKLENVSGLVITIDTPGGEAKAATVFVQALKDFKKPVVSYIQGNNASLGVWLSSATDEVYFDNQSNEIGSIGGYCRLVDYSKQLEKAGIKLINVYAPQSTEKNRSYKEALAGNPALIQDELAVWVDSFIEFVKEQRPKAIASENTWRTGKMFKAKEAISLGLADGILNFNQVIGRVAFLSRVAK